MPDGEYNPQPLTEAEYLALVKQMLDMRVQSREIDQRIADTLYVNEQQAIAQQKADLSTIGQTAIESGLEVIGQGVSGVASLTKLPMFNDVVKWMGTFPELERKAYELQSIATMEQGWFEILRAQGGAETAANRRALAEFQARKAVEAKAPPTAPPREPVPITPEIPSPTGAYQEALKGLPYAAQRYFAGQGEEVYSEFEKLMPGAREAWWQAINVQPQNIGGIVAAGQRTMLEQAQAKVGQATEAQAQLKSLTSGIFGMPFFSLPQQRELTPTEQYLREVGEGKSRAMAEVGALQEEMAKGTTRFATGDLIVNRAAPDPWEEYLKTGKFLQAWRRLPAQARGLYTGQYKPPTRWY